MKGRLVAGALLALTVMLGGCVAQTADDEGVTESSEALAFELPQQVTGKKQHLDDEDTYVTPVLLIDEGDDGDPTDPDPNPWTPAHTNSDPGSPNEPTTPRKH